MKVAPNRQLAINQIFFFVNRKPLNPCLNRLFIFQEGKMDFASQYVIKGNGVDFVIYNHQ